MSRRRPFSQELPGGSARVTSPQVGPAPPVHLGGGAAGRRERRVMCLGTWTFADLEGKEKTTPSVGRTLRRPFAQGRLLSLQPLWAKGSWRAAGQELKRAGGWEEGAAWPPSRALIPHAGAWRPGLSWLE